ncbi:MAG: hypothetical protein HYY52_01900 [Candidatus Melainabacteria bacterium]|nr:hypothetical protein [Candidatus Melainabacteria bacterium]
MMKNYSNDELKKMSNKELEKELSAHEWLHRDLLHEYDKRCYEGRIKFGPPIKPEELEEHFRKRREMRQVKKAS